MILRRCCHRCCPCSRCINESAASSVFERQNQRNGELDLVSTKSSLAYCSHEQFLSVRSVVSIRMVRQDDLKSGSYVKKLILKSICVIAAQHCWKKEMFLKNRLSFSYSFRRAMGEPTKCVENGKGRNSSALFTWV